MGDTGRRGDSKETWGTRGYAGRRGGTWEVVAKRGDRGTRSEEMEARCYVAAWQGTQCRTGRADGKKNY